jgi:hypothetical protein
MAERPSFDPYAILAALERRRVTYVVIGAFARVVQGAEEITHGIDVVPAIRAENLRRLTLALEDLDASRVDGKPILVDETTIRDEPPLELRSPAGELKIVPEPAGTRRLRRPPPRGDTRTDRQGPPPLDRVDRRPRAHARRPRPRSRHAEADRPPPPPRT